MKNKNFKGLSRKEMNFCLPREFIIENWPAAELKAVVKSLNKQILVLMKKEAEEIKTNAIDLLILEKVYYFGELKKRNKKK